MTQRTPLELAVLFHETYERLAPDFGYETRPDTKSFDPESKNGRLMVAVCSAVCAEYEAERVQAAELRAICTTPEFMRVNMRNWSLEQRESFCLHMLGDYWQELKPNAETLARVVLAYIRANPPTGANAIYPNPTWVAMEQYATDLLAPVAPPVEIPLPQWAGVIEPSPQIRGIEQAIAAQNGLPPALLQDTGADPVHPHFVPVEQYATADTVYVCPKCGQGFLPQPVCSVCGCVFS